MFRARKTGSKRFSNIFINETLNTNDALLRCNFLELIDVNRSILCLSYMDFFKFLLPQGSIF